MMSPNSPPHVLSTANTDNDTELVFANRLASEVKGRWRRGEQPDVAVLLRQHPELKRYKSTVLDLAHYEYRLRLEAGESVDAAEFARRFPTLQRSLYLLIEVHRLLDFDSDLRTVQEDVSWPAIGEDFLGFLLVGELGRGTFARVFLASQPALGNRLVAVKVAPEGGKEAEVLGKLRHPNIVPVYSVQEDAATGLTAVCMPYLGRATLCDVLDRAFVSSDPPRLSRVILDAVQEVSDPHLPQSASPDRVLRKGSYVEGILHLAVQITDALAYAHSHGVCHRDLKPSNILVSPDGRPLLLDFNLSFDEQVNVSRAGGTLPYMAPEQLRTVVVERSRHEGRVDPRSDLFSLGVIFYELLCGSLPYGAIPWDRPVGAIAEHLLGQQQKGPQPIQHKNDQVDKGLAQLLEGCLAFDPERRPASARDLTTSFRRQLAPTSRAKRWARNHPRQVCLMVSVLLTFLLCVAGVLALRDPYTVRQFGRGRSYSEHGQYELAIECFDEAIRCNPDYSEALFARGRAYQELENFRLAFEDFDAAFRLAPRARTAACKGYCLNNLRYHEEAIKCYAVAMKMGLCSPRLLNNLGFSYIQLNRLDDAEQCLNEAVKGDEDLQAAHHNLVIVFLRQARDGRAVQSAALLHASKAVASGSPSADLYHDAAALYALAANQDSRFIRQAIEYLGKAVAYGLDPGRLKSDPIFFSLRKNADFDHLCRAAASTKAPSKAVRLVDPL